MQFQGNLGAKRTLVEVRVHGRGGQGNVAAAELLAQAAFLAGEEVQAFPSFGAERTAPAVVAFVGSATRRFAFEARSTPLVT